MSIPQKADKWIVFALVLVLGVVWLVRSTVPGGFTVTEWAVIPLIAAVIITTFYVIWCTACPLIARPLLITPTPGNVRILANSSFLVIMIVLIFVPGEGTETFERPAKVHVEEVILTRPESDARSQAK